MSFYFGIIIIILILLFYNKLLYSPIKAPKVSMEDLIRHNVFKSGDLVLFNTQNNYTSHMLFNHITHVGIVYVKKGEILLFETTHNRHQDFNISTKNTVITTPIYKRLTNYPGFVYYKKLNKNLTNNMLKKMDDFVNYSLDNKNYDLNFIDYFMNKFILGETFRDNVNCVEILYELFDYLDLYDYKDYIKNIGHPLKKIEKLKILKNGYNYSDIIKIEKEYY